MEDHQSAQGLCTLITLSSLCVLIFIIAYVLTFVRKEDTSDVHH